MGNFLQQLKNCEVNSHLQIVNLTYSKLRQCYATFKSISDSYTLDVNIFSQIFNCSFEQFNIFDPEKNEVVNAIEIFSGAILHCDSSFQLKIKFIFDFFDFNQEQTLGFDVLQFIILSSVNANIKIYELNLKEQQTQEQIAQLINNYFYNATSLTFQQFLEWCSKVDQIRTFFTIINKSLPIVQQIEHHFSLPRTLNFKSQRPPYESVHFNQQHFKQTGFQQMLQVLCNFSIRNLTMQRQVCHQFDLRLVWCFGMNIQGLRRPLDLIRRSQQKRSLQKIIYMCQKNAVVFFPKLNKQLIYQEHQAYIQTVTLAKLHTLVATGETAKLPVIHIWDYLTLNTIIKLKGRHRGGIQLLQFICRDEYLITTSSACNNPLFVYYLQDQSVVLSMSLDSLPVQILVLSDLQSTLFGEGSSNQLTRKLYQNVQEDCSFLIACKKSIRIIKKQKSRFLSNELIVPHQEVYDDLIGSVFIGHDGDGFIYTAHEKGLVVKWSTSLKVMKSCKSKFSVRGIQKIQSNIILLSSQRLQMVDSQLVHLNSFNLNQSQSISHNFVFCKPVADRIIFLTELGDVLEAEFQGYGVLNFKKKHYGIVRFVEAIGVMKLNKEMAAIYSRVGVVKIINLKLRDITGAFYLGRQVQKCAAYMNQEKIVLAYVSKNTLYYQVRKLQFLLSENQVALEGSVSDLQFSPDHSNLIVACQSGKIYDFYSLTENHWRVVKCSHIQQRVQSFFFNQDSKSFIVLSQQKNFWKVTLPDLKSRNLTLNLQQIQISSIFLKYPLSNLSKPVILLSESLSLCGLPNKGVIFWSSMLRAKSYEGVLNFQVQDILDLGEGNLAFLTERGLYQFNLKSSQNTKDSLQKSVANQTIRDQIRIATSEQINKDRISDCFVQLSQLSQKTIASSPGRFIAIKEGLQKIRNQQLKQFRPPPLRLNLQHVFTFDCNIQRRTLFYAHHYLEPAKQQRTLKERSRITGKAQNVKEMLFPKQSLIPYDQEHQTCSKHFVYKAGRVAVIYDPYSKKQKFYQGHSRAISCLAIHPFKSIMASGQVSPTPFIHVWQLNGSIINKIQTIHQKGVKQIFFSRDGSLLGSYGSDKSLQVTEWRSCQMIAYRFNVQDQLLDLSFNPYNKFEIASCGYRNVTIWLIQGRNILKRQHIESKFAGYLTALSFISYAFGSQIESDLILGCSQGELGFVSCGNYITVSQHAHQSMINCIKVTQIFSYKIIVLTAGQDQEVNIWDTKFNLIAKFQLRSISFFKGFNINQSLAPQSLDIYLCKLKQNDQEINNNPQILIGTRSGHIFQVTLSIQFKGLKEIDQVKKTNQATLKYDLKNDMKQDQFYNQSQSIRFSFVLHLRSHVSPPKSFVAFAIFQRLDMLVTAGADRSLILWNLQMNRQLLSIDLQHRPKSIGILAQKDLILVGLASGAVVVYELKFTTIYSLKALFMLKEKQNKGLYPDQIKVNSKGNILAVSFNPSHQKPSNSPQILVYKLIFDSKLKLVDKSNFVFQNDLNVSEELSDRFIPNFAIKSISFSIDESLLLVMLVPVEGGLKVHSDSRASAFAWNFGKVQVIREIEQLSTRWQQTNFSCYVIGNYVQYQQIMHSSQRTQLRKSIPYSNNFRIKFSNILPFQGSLLMTTNSGQIVSSRPTFLTQSCKQSCFGRIFPGHQDSIELMGMQKNSLVSSSLDGSLYKWSIVQEKEHWDLGYLQHKPAQLDSKFIYSFEEFELLKNQIIPLRETISDSRSISSDLQLEFVKALGRQANRFRNNLFYDSQEKVIYSWGCKLIVADFKSTQNQEIVNFREGDADNFTEISVITMSPDRKLLGIATVQQNCKMFILQYSSRSYVQQFALRDSLIIMIAKFSHDNHYMACKCITRDYQETVFLIDLVNKQIVSATKFPYASFQRIKDFMFYGPSPNFLSCGKQHLGQFKTKGGTLQFQCYELDDTKQLIQFKDAKEQIDVDFFNIILVKDQIIAGAADGYLYLWESARMTNKQNAHPDSAIYALYASPNSQIFASGGADGRVILWILGHGSIIQKYFQYPIFQARIGELVMPMYEIQSLAIGSSFILAGTRSGRIYQLTRPDLVERDKESGKQTIFLRQSGFNDDIPVQVIFDSSSDIINVITRSGRLLALQTENLKLINEVIFFQAMEVVSMHISNRFQLLIIGFQRQIKAVRYSEGIVGQSKFQQKFSKNIKDVKFSRNQKFIAVLQSANKHQNSKIDLFSLFEEGLELVKSFENLPTSTQEIDFSTDSYHLVYMNEEERVVIDLNTMNKATANQYQLEWCSSGNKSSDYFRGIFQYFQDENKIQSMVRIDKQHLAVTDKTGNIKIFTEKGVQKGVYSFHLNSVTKIALSSNLNFLASIGQRDRSVVLWRIHYSNEDSQE